MSAMSATAGFLLVDKAAGLTSFDVVALVRRRLGVRRVGHGGTLDPDATGVLPILVGEGTKLTPWLLDHDKEYVVTVRLGVRTETQDLSGRVLSTAAVPALLREEVEAATRRFVGRIRQVPPMYSALHHQGRRLHELARQGLEVDRAPRDVLVSSIRVEAIDLPLLTLGIACGRGVYIRTLAADLGEVLGCGGAVEHLVRTRVGPWRIEDAIASDIIAGTPPGALWARLRPLAAALPGWPRVMLGEVEARAFTHGQAVACAPDLTSESTLVMVLAAPDQLLGVGELSSGRTRIRPLRLLHADRPRPSALAV